MLEKIENHCDGDLISWQGTRISVKAAFFSKIGLQHRKTDLYRPVVLVSIVLSIPSFLSGTTLTVSR